MAAWPGPQQPAALTLFKAGGVVAAGALLATLGWRLASAIAAPPPGPIGSMAAIGGLVLGYLAADLLSGTAHWFCDTFFDETTPVVGPVVIQPFRDHHRYPGRITRYRFLEQDTTNFLVMLPALAMAAWLGAPQPGSAAGLFWCTGLAAMALGSFGTNLFHKWAHMRRPPAPARWLQRVGLILTPRRHHTHHGDHGRGFCVTSGWLNPALDRVRFFPRLERAVRLFRR